MSAQFLTDLDRILDYSPGQLRRWKRTNQFITFCARMRIELTHVHRDDQSLKRLTKAELLDVIDGFVRAERPAGRIYNHSKRIES